MTSRTNANSHWLRHAEDRRAMLFLLALSGIYIAHWFGGTSAHWLAFPGAVFAISACVVKHNHIHAPTFRSPRLNRALNFWLALLTGTSTTGIRIAHNQRHHRASQSPDDFVRCSLVQRYSALAAFVSFFPLVVVQTWRHARDDVASLRRRSAPLHLLQRLEQAAIWLLIGITLWLNWLQFFWVFVIPWLASQWFLVTINLLQHDGLDARSELLDSRNMTGALSNWLFLNNGYHTAHHLRPALHWSQLPEYHWNHIGPRIPKKLESASLSALFFDWLKARAGNGPSELSASRQRT